MTNLYEHLLYYNVTLKAIGTIYVTRNVYV